MLTIDGSTGEGGGQILRSALALSMATGVPFRISNIRGGRPKPGMMRQHLVCVQAAATISGAEIAGATVGSKEVTFSPGAVRAGTYHFPIGTAGGTMLVLQAILPALLRAPSPSSITVEGGTHNTHAPPFEFFERALVPLLNRAGANVRARLERHGFYPAGGGRVVVEIEPANPQPIEILERGAYTGARAIAIVSGLTRSIAVRELEVLRARLGLEEAEAEPVVVQNPIGPGNAVTVELRYEHVTEVFSGLGEMGKSAETVAREIAQEVREYRAAQRPIGPHLADQLMVPLALLAGGRFSTGPLTQHARTNMEIASLFGVRVAASPEGLIDVAPLGR